MVCLLSVGLARRQRIHRRRRPIVGARHRRQLRQLPRHRRPQPRRRFRRSPAATRRRIVAADEGLSDGKRPATVMHQIAKGYTDAQIEALAAYLSAQKRDAERSEPTCARCDRDARIAARSFRARRRRRSRVGARWRLRVDAAARRQAARWSSSAAATAARPRRSTCACGAIGTIDVTLVERNARVRLLPDVQPGDRRLAARWPTSPCLRRARRDGACAACATKRWRSIPRRARCGSRGGATLPYDRLIVSPGVDFMWDAGAGAGQRRGAGEGAARLEGGAADRRAAPPARGDARRRRLRDPRSAGAVSLPAGALRARLPGRALLQDERSRSPRC